ncbi:MAG: SurA N-terminal domain-containing protein [Deltaproteobacteria bacterium]|nr:SurA N-terminal domain-containing protein [Deltaproteobacteria bacterium]
MLEYIRKRSSSVYVLIALGIIILVFIFWGGGSGDKEGGRQGLVAVVGGERISAKDYENVLRRQTEYFRNIFKGQLNDEMLKKLDLKKRTLDGLINRALAVQEADRQGILISDKDVQGAVAAMQVFQQNGVFDNDLYQRTLKENRLNAAEFEKSIKDEIAATKIQGKVAEGVKVADDEVRDAYLMEMRKINLEYIEVPPSRFASAVKVTDDEAKAFLQKNSSDFLTPARVNAFYSYAGFEELAKHVKVTEDEIKDYYAKNEKRFELPPRVKARHILIKPDENEKDLAKAKKAAADKAGEMLARLKKGEKFAELAKKYSDDKGSGSHGGDLGWFSKGMMVKPFEDAALGMKKGDMSGLVQTEFGYHIILVQDRQESRRLPVKEVEPMIRKMLAKQKAWSLARDSAREFDGAFKEAKDVAALKKAASKVKGARTGTTGLVTETGIGGELAKDVKLREALFLLKDGGVSGPVETDKGVYVFKALQREDSSVLGYKDVAGKVKERMLLEKSLAEARTGAEGILTRIRGGEDIRAIAKNEKYAVSETGFFKRGDGVIPKIGAGIGEAEKIFDLKKDAPNYPELVLRNNKYYILKLKDTQDADENGLVSRKEDIRARLIAQKQQEALKKWLAELRAKTKIEVFEQNM